jgi:hypothetical protein
MARHDVKVGDEWGIFAVGGYTTGKKCENWRENVPYPTTR